MRRSVAAFFALLVCGLYLLSAFGPWPWQPFFGAGAVLFAFVLGFWIRCVVDGRPLF